MKKTMTAVIVCLLIGIPYAASDKKCLSVLSFKALLDCAMFRETCLAMALQEKLHEILHSVTAPLRNR